MQGITSSTKLLMRLATFIAAIIAVICLGLAVFVLINKLINWDTYPVGEASTTVGIFFLGAVQLFFIGVLGEYILSINSRVTQKPRVVVGERVNFWSDPALRRCRCRDVVADASKDETSETPQMTDANDRACGRVSPRAPASRTVWQFARFLVVGLASFAVDYGHLLRAVPLLRRPVHRGEHHLVLALARAQLLPHAEVRVHGEAWSQHPLEFAIYVGLNAIALGLNQLILFLTVDVFGLSPLVGKLIATAVVLVYNFISRKLLIERVGAQRLRPVVGRRADSLNTGGRKP